MTRIALGALAALAACATGGQPFAPPPPSFTEVKTLVLVRAAEGRAGRAKDPLDGLDESLRARGYQTRIVQLDAKPSRDQAALEKLFLQLESRAGAPRGDRFGPRPYGDAGKAAGETVAALGVDAVATYHRLDGRRPLAPASSEPLLPGSMYQRPTLAPGGGPMGALAVVDRSGHVATFAWGEPTDTGPDPTVPVNAAEAIDLVVRTLAGQEPDDDR
jgi:hypothetical protein